MSTVGRPAETGSRAREVRRARDDVAIEARVQFAHGATGGSANGAIPTDVRAHLRSMLLCPASPRHSRVSPETSVSGAALCAGGSTTGRSGRPFDRRALGGSASQMRKLNEHAAGRARLGKYPGPWPAMRAS
jgi:hypothetical protein